jgi:SAM-dependent methyltransferase
MNASAGTYYDVDAYVAELYDAQEKGTQDVALIRRLIGGSGPLSILEPFYGTGRILMPLALDGHRVVGLDRSRGMLARVRHALARLRAHVSPRVTLRAGDALSDPWPTGYDLVIMGGNCLYELATAEDQATVISRAETSLVPGGHLYLDNDHMEGPLDPAWRSSERAGLSDGHLRGWHPYGEFSLRDMDRRLRAFGSL